MHLTCVALQEMTCTQLCGVHRTRWDGSSFMRHQPCQRRMYTVLVDIQKRAIKTSNSCRIKCERSESVRERRIALLKKAINNKQVFFVVVWGNQFRCTDPIQFQMDKQKRFAAGKRVGSRETFRLRTMLASLMSEPSKLMDWGTKYGLKKTPSL